MFYQTEFMFRLLCLNSLTLQVLRYTLTVREKVWLFVQDLIYIDVMST